MRTIEEHKQAILDKIMEIKEESIELKSALEDADAALDVLGVIVNEKEIS